MTHQLTPTLIAVEVPAGQTRNDYEIVRCQDNFKMRQLHYPSDVYMEIYQNYGCVNIGEFDLRFLGTVTKDTIDFDCEPYVDEYIATGHYKDYTDPDCCYSVAWASFRSLLEIKGLFFVNPIKKLVILEKI